MGHSLSTFEMGTMNTERCLFVSVMPLGSSVNLLMIPSGMFFTNLSWSTLIIFSSSPEDPFTTHLLCVAMTQRRFCICQVAEMSHGWIFNNRFPTWLTKICARGAYSLVHR